MTAKLKPNIVYHADWGSTPEKRWCAKATLGSDGHYTAHAPCPVGNLSSVFEQFRDEAGGSGCAVAGFDFPIGIPKFYADRARISSFRDFLTTLQEDDWKDFGNVCDEPEQISLHRPFYPDNGYDGRRKEDLFRGHGVSSIEPLLRRCERGGEGRREACCLFWTLGGNQVGKAAIIGWLDMLVPALSKDTSILIWPFDGSLQRLLSPGKVVVVETYPAEYYAWFSKEPLGKKGRADNRKKLAPSLLRWADTSGVHVENELHDEIRCGFPRGDDAFDAAIGLFGIIEVLHARRSSGEPNDATVKDVEGWILGRTASADASTQEAITVTSGAARTGKSSPRVFWYGERGIVNAVVSHISEPENIVGNIEALLGAVCWGNGATPDWVRNISDIALVVEVGLADFGDPDLLIVCYTPTETKLVFLEAKVISYTESMQPTSPFEGGRWGMEQNGFNSSINGQLTLKYRFAKALSRWDGTTPAIVEDESIYEAYRARLNDSPSKAPGRTLVKQTILTGILKRLGLNGIAEENCCFVALTWDARSKAFFHSKDVPNDRLPVFLDETGTDVFANCLDRVGWIGYTELEMALGMADSPEYVGAFATMLDAKEPNEAFYSEHRRGQWNTFEPLVVSLATRIATCFGSSSQRWEGSFSIQDENRQTIAKIIPMQSGVFVGVRDGVPLLVSPSLWNGGLSHVVEKKVRRVKFIGIVVDSVAKAADFIVQLKGKTEPEATMAECTLEESEP